MTLAVALLTLVAASPVRWQDKTKPGEETRMVRIFVIDRTDPDRPFQDAAAMLTLERTSGRSETFLFPRAGRGSAPLDENAPPGLIRGLVMTPYFVELNLGEPARPRREEETAPANGAAASPQDILRRAHKGTWFERKMPASAFSEPFTATVTIRLRTLAFTSEEFQGPRSPHDVPEEIASRVDRSLETLKERAAAMVGFMDLRPAAVELRRELSKLSQAGFDDATGTIEKDRQWCLALARAIDDACYSGNTGRIQDLSMECGPRMKSIHALLAKPKAPEAPPPQAPETPPTVK